MYKRVDGTEDEFEGFSYLDVNGDEEFVSIVYDCVTIKDSSHNQVNIYKNDVPKLIKALQSAYEYKENCND